jgi:hypothetical protein
LLTLRFEKDYNREWRLFWRFSVLLCGVDI